MAVGIVVQGAEKGHALDVVPVEMGDENVSGERALAELALQFVPSTRNPVPQSKM